MSRYRGNLYRIAHPKIYIFSHTQKAEIEYFQDFKQHLSSDQIIPNKIVLRSPQQLINKVIDWKKRKDISAEDGDQVWCVFDVDDFYKNDRTGLLRAVDCANRNEIKIAYVNDCFELWILLHFKQVTSPIGGRGKYVNEIDKFYTVNGLGNFSNKNQRCFDNILAYQGDCIKNAKTIASFGSYNEIIWSDVLSDRRNPSTSIHLLVEEILKIHPKHPS
jgi:hypothetical protein